MSHCVVYNSGMEIANLWAGVGKDIEGVRIARLDEAQAITDLLRQASYAHLHADWHYPADWLGKPGFVVVERGQDNPRDGSLASRIFGSLTGLRACLAVAADPLPAAWVRVAAVTQSSQALQLLASMLNALTEDLGQNSVSSLNWLLIEKWPDAWLQELGFTVQNYVETYVKQDSEIPIISEVPGLTIRAVRDSDLHQIEYIEVEAFAPLWRHGVASLGLARRQAISFDVAEHEGRVVGYQFSTPAQTGVHLARMTIHPDFQGIGVGTQLLAHTCLGYRRLGIDQISLNTQADNIASRKLYERFGFWPNGQSFPVWVVEL